LQRSELQVEEVAGKMKQNEAIRMAIAAYILGFGLSAILLFLISVFVVLPTLAIPLLIGVAMMWAVYTLYDYF